MTVVQEPDRVAAQELSTTERIRNAALRSFATNGAAATSLRTVASAAGVSLGLVQHHYATKAGLIKAVDEHVLSQVLTAMSQPIPEAGDSLVEVGHRVGKIVSEQTDIADYLGRALIDGSPLGASIFDALVGFGTARWHQRNERGELRPDLDLTWAAMNAMVLALGAVVLRTHIERQLPAPLTDPVQLSRWEDSVNELLREGFFRRTN
jgi:AcrR family transcriptional regulator